jgi:hypothetical protein
MDEKLSIENLNGFENWATWKFQLEHLLRAKGLWGFVTGNETLAAGANPQAQAEFQRRGDRAFSTVVLHVSPKQLYLITSCKSTKEAWDTLRNNYERETLGNKLFLKKSYYRTMMPEGMPVQEHLKNMKELGDRLAAIGAPIPEEDQMVTLLGSLPLSYSTLVTALEARVDDLTLKFVQQALINEEQKRNDTSDGKSSSGACSAMASRTYGHTGSTGSSQNPSWKGGGTAAAPVTQRKKNSPGKSIKCYGCSGFGHIKRDCPSKKRQSSSNSSHRAQNVNMPNPDTDDASGETWQDGNGIAFSAQVGKRKTGGTWLVDSGASKHMTYEKEHLTNYLHFRKPQLVGLGDGRSVDALGVGNIHLNMAFKTGKPMLITMHNVLYVPKLAANLFSVGAAAEKRKIVQFGHTRCWIRNETGNLLGMGTRARDGLYQLDCKPVVKETASLVFDNSFDLWHQRLGHLNANQLRELAHQVTTTGIRIPRTGNLSFCEGCVEGKMHRKPLKSVGEIRSNRRLQLIHSDVCGPMQTMSIGGCRYFVTFIDDYSRCCKVYFMKQKSETMDKFKEFQAVCTSECGERIGKLRTDNGGEYVSKEFEEYLKSQGIIHQTTVPHSPEQNGVAERKNRTLVESARSMLSHAGLPKKFWAEAVATAAYVGNRIPTSAMKNNTPYEAWYNRKPSLAHMRVFGCIAYAHVPDIQRRKLDKKAIKLRFIGYDSHTKGYRLFDEDNGKVVIRRDVEFNEADFGDSILVDSDNVTVKKDVDLTSEEENTVEGPQPQRPERQRRPPVRYGYDEYADMTVHHVAYRVCQITEPTTMEEALTSDHAREWTEAADSEYESLLKNETWELVELPPDRKPIGSKWVFKIKHGKDGKVDRFKARLVAKGYAQKYGIDYDETFSPVVRFSSIRLLLTFAVQRDMLIHQMDAVTAFLNGKLDEEIYMEQPDGYIKPGQEQLVCKLKRSLYGLKQSPRCWNKAFQEYMGCIGFAQSAADPCVYIKIANVLTIVAVYVDDLIVISETAEEMEKIKKELAVQFKMKDMGELHYCLGMSIEQDKEQNSIKLHQKEYICSMIEKYGLSEANPVSTPVDVNVKLVKDDEISKEVDPKLYQSMVGSLLYAAMTTRPDIAYAVGVVSKFNSKPSEAHLTAVKRILRYLKGTADLALKYQKSDHGMLIGYSDADWAGDLDDRHSTTGNLFLMEEGAVSWLSKKQATVSLSTAEAEYVALSKATQEAVWLRRLLVDLQMPPDNPTLIMEDNQGAIAMARNPVGHARTKHIDIRYHFVREALEQGTIDVQYCPTKEMLADLFTKPLPREQFEKLRSGIGLVDMKKD